MEADRSLAVGSLRLSRPAPVRLLGALGGVDTVTHMRVLEPTSSTTPCAWASALFGVLTLLFGFNISRVPNRRAEQITERGCESYRTLDQHEPLRRPLGGSAAPDEKRGAPRPSEV